MGTGRIQGRSGRRRRRKEVPGGSPKTRRRDEIKMVGTRLYCRTAAGSPKRWASKRKRRVGI
eukprot:8844801-Karenia_brevis.AAC.1